MTFLEMILQREIRVTEQLISDAEEREEKAQTDWRQGFNAGLKLSYENKLDALKQIQQEVERNEPQRPSITA